MAVIEGGVSAALAGVGAEAQKGLHVIVKPDDVGSLGAYRISGLSGSIAAALAANSEIFQFRWTDATRLCVIKSLRLTGIRATTAFAAGSINLQAFIARAWTADGSGGTALTPTVNANKMRTSMGTSLVGAVRIASTGALTAGTKTLDAQPIAGIYTHSSGGTGSATPIIGSIYQPSVDFFVQRSGDYPVVLAQNEGLVVRATVPGTGVWEFGMDIEWAELTAY